MGSRPDVLQALEKVNEFTNRTIRHPKLDSAIEKLLYVLMFADPSSIILLFGPSGVGKTTLLTKMIKLINDICLDKMEADPSFIPIVSTVAKAPDNGIFNWKDFYIRFLKGANDAVPDKKINHQNLESIDEFGQIRARYRDISGTAYKNAYESFLIHRRPFAVLIDEAQHLQKMAVGRRLKDQMDVIKNLSEATKTKHVLFGTYELLDLANLSGQLNRRTISIHFSRYQHMKVCKDDFIQFQSVLLTFQDMLPLNEKPDLVKHSEYMYQYSAGCVGILKDWLKRSLAQALSQNKNTITLQILKENALHSKALRQIAKEIKEGERSMDVNCDIESAGLLGMRDFQDSSAETMPKKPNEKPKAFKPFNRRPTRDVIGGR